MMMMVANAVREYRKATESSSVWLTFYAYKHIRTDDVHHVAMPENIIGNFFCLSLQKIKNKNIKCISDPDQMFISCFTNESSPVLFPMQ